MNELLYAYSTPPVQPAHDQLGKRGFSGLPVVGNPLGTLSRLPEQGSIEHHFWKTVEEYEAERPGEDVEDTYNGGESVALERQLTLSIFGDDVTVFVEVGSLVDADGVLLFHQSAC